MRVLRDKGGIPKVVRPLYKEGPPQRQRRFAFGSDPEIWPHAKNETVAQFGHILASWKRIFLTFLVSVSDMASHGGPRVPQGYPRR